MSMAMKDILTVTIKENGYRDGMGRRELNKCEIKDSEL
jgi:hypothetical protein